MENSAIEATHNHTLVMSLSERSRNGSRAPAVHVGALFDSLNAGASTAFNSDLANRR